MTKQTGKFRESTAQKLAKPVALRTRLLARLMVALIRLLYLTLRVKTRRENEVLEWLRRYDGGMLVTWHGRTLIPIVQYRGRGYHMLVSLSNDGDFLSQYFHFAGLRVIRGSSSRRAIAAAREGVEVLKAGGVLAFTPDGPRGPTQVAQMGVAYMAQRSGRPVICGGIAAKRRWFSGSWDRFMVPKPFSRAEFIYGDPIFVGPDEDLNEAAARIGAVINRLQAEAERAVGHEPDTLTESAPTVRAS